MTRAMGTIRNTAVTFRVMWQSVGPDWVNELF